MIWLFFGLLFLFALMLLTRQIGQANRAQLSRWLRYGGAGLMALIAAFFALTGRLPIAAPFAGFAMLLLGGAGGVLRRTLFGGNSAGSAGSGPNNAGSSEVETDYLRMRLDHQSGDITGEVLRGEQAGKKLDMLDLAQSVALYHEVSEVDPQSVAVLETWLDSRFGDDWRDAARKGEGADKSDQANRGQSGRRARSSGGAMTRAEALELLGLSEGVGREEIRAAHRRLMQKFHPDHGGSDYLASRINQAKEVLLS
ncbi:MAG TPA: molecular chaperone DnaJ [Alphaproteobacteria bacterium]|nr:molecular chaperone DnaJ [Alphaproteobacteria bacterium]